MKFYVVELCIYEHLIGKAQKEHFKIYKKTFTGEDRTCTCL